MRPFMLLFAARRHPVQSFCNDIAPAPAPTPLQASPLPILHYFPDAIIATTQLPAAPIQPAPGPATMSALPVNPAELLAAMASGDQRALDALYRAWSPRVRVFADWLASLFAEVV